MYSPKNQLIGLFRSGLKRDKAHLERIIYLEKRLSLDMHQKQLMDAAKKSREALVKQWELLIELEENRIS
jgi:hypothetical protein